MHIIKVEFSTREISVDIDGEKTTIPYRKGGCKTLNAIEFADMLFRRYDNIKCFGSTSYKIELTQEFKINKQNNIIISDVHTTESLQVKYDIRTNTYECVKPIQVMIPEYCVYIYHGACTKINYMFNIEDEYIDREAIINGLHRFEDIQWDRLRAI